MTTKKTVIEYSEDDDDDLLDNSRDAQVARRLQKELDQEVTHTLSLPDILLTSKVVPKKRKTPANNVNLKRGGKCLILTYRNNPALQLPTTNFDSTNTPSLHIQYLYKCDDLRVPASSIYKEQRSAEILITLAVNTPCLKDKTFQSSHGLRFYPYQVEGSSAGFGAYILTILIQILLRQTLKSSKFSFASDSIYHNRVALSYMR